MSTSKHSHLFLLIILFIGSCNYTLPKNTSSQSAEILAKFHNPNSEVVLIAAHRAMHTQYPENSLAAFQHAIDAKIDIIEADFRTTKDGKIVLLHDDTIDRTTNGKGELKDFTFAQLQKLELVKKEGDPNTYRIPLARDAFKLAKGKIIIDIDIKAVSIEALVNLVMETQVEKQVLFFDSDFEVLDKIKRIDSTLLLMPRAHSFEEVEFIINKYHPKVIHIDPSFYSEKVVDLIKKSGARVWINALGAPDKKAVKSTIEEGYAPLIKGRANIIQTDYPLLLKQYLSGWW